MANSRARERRKQETKRIREEGWAAFMAGKQPSANPYEDIKGSPNAAQWWLGYNDAADDAMVHCGKPAPRSTLVDLLKQARRLNNQTVRNTHELDAWHCAVDRALSAEEDGDTELDQRYDAPARVEHRKFVNALFTRGE